MHRLVVIRGSGENHPSLVELSFVDQVLRARGTLGTDEATRRGQHHDERYADRQRWMASHSMGDEKGEVAHSGLQSEDRHALFGQLDTPNGRGGSGVVTQAVDSARDQAQSTASQVVAGQ